MQKFKFKLQPVLYHRQKKEDVIKKELAAARQVLEEEECLLRKFQHKFADLQSELRSKQHSSINASEAVSYLNYIEKVEMGIEAQIVGVIDAEEEVKKTQERLIEASKGRRILEKLHDKKLEEFKQEVEKTEQNSIDEIATIRQGRK